MATLRYGTETFDLADESVPAILQSIGAKSSSETGGWVTFTDAAGQDWSIIVRTGVPICINAKPESSTEMRSARIR